VAATKKCSSFSYDRRVIAAGIDIIFILVILAGALLLRQTGGAALLAA